MTAKEYMGKLLPQYETTFDLHKPYHMGTEEYAAYGYFCSHSEKYVLSREAKLWEADSFEHILFFTAQQIDEIMVEEVVHVLENRLEPQLVRGGKKNPEKNHMYSYLTCALISDGEISEEAVRKIRKYKFYKNYMFSFRGYSEGRIVAVDLARQKVFTNGAGKNMKKLYTRLLS